MCIKSIYYNTHGDGSQDVTEFVDTCSFGEMCRHPQIREFKRKPSAYYSDQHLRLPPTPRRSQSPSPSRKHKSAVYINDEKVADIPSGKKRHSHLPTRSDRDRVILHAPEPPAPQRLSRSSTMPVEYTTPERSSRHRPGAYYRRHVAGPEEFVYVNDEHEQRERRRANRRSSATHGRSSDFSSSSAAGASDTVRSAHRAPAVAAAGKKLRWEDEVEAEIMAQNERISARPALHQEVKGILKPRKGKDAEIYDDLRRAVDRMDIAASGKDRSSTRLSDSAEYKYDLDRLRARFGDDPKDRRRRSRVSYGAGLYDYQ